MSDTEGESDYSPRLSEMSYTMTCLPENKTIPSTELLTQPDGQQAIASPCNNLDCNVTISTNPERKQEEKTRKISMRKKTPRPEKMITTEQSQNNKSDILLMSDGISLSTDDEEGEEAAKDKMLEKHKVRNVAFRRSNIGIAVQWWSAWLNI